MNIVFLSLNASWSHSSFVVPLFEQCCKGEKDWRWSTVESTINEKPEGVIERLLEQQPSVILCTCYLFTVEPVLAVLSRFKKLMPTVPVLLGGPEFLGDNRHFIETHAFVDAVVRGEGEGIILELLKAVESKETFDGISGVCFRNADGDVHDDGFEPPLLSMAELPDPMESHLFDWEKGFVQLETSRGCPAVCSFCTSAISPGGRRLSVEQVRERIMMIRDRKVENVRLLDRTFNYPKARAESIIRMMVEEFRDMNFHLEIYPNLVTDEMLKLIAEARPGQLHIEIGIQTTRNKILQEIKRSPFNEWFQEVLGMLCDLRNIALHVDLIVGLPQQDFESVAEDLRVLAKVTPEEVQLEVLKILNGTPLAKDVDRYGIAYADAPPYEVLKTDTLCFSEIQRCMRLSRLLDQFYNDSEFRSVVAEYWRSDPNLWLELDAFLQSPEVADTQLMSLKARYHCFHRFLVCKQPELADELALCWIRNGNSPLKGLVDASPWKGEPPIDFEQVYEYPFGEAIDNIMRRDAKTYCIDFKHRRYLVKLYKKSQKELIVLGEWAEG